MNSMRDLTFSSCSAVTSTSLRNVGERWDRAVPPAPRLMLEDVELELRPESVIGDGWQSGKKSCTPVWIKIDVHTIFFCCIPSFHSDEKSKLYSWMESSSLCFFFGKPKFLHFNSFLSLSDFTTWQNWPVRLNSGAAGFTVRTLGSLYSLLRRSTIATDWTLLFAPWTTSRCSSRRLQCS